MLGVARAEYVLGTATISRTEPVAAGSLVDSTGTIRAWQHA
jgi:hypothetical protein